MTVEKIFYRDLNLFYENNKNMKLKKSQFLDKIYNNIDNLINIYPFLEYEDIKRNLNDGEFDFNNAKTRNFSLKKLSDPLFIMMINCVVKNNKKNKNAKLENFSLKSYMDYKKFTIEEIENLPNDLSIKLKDSAIYEYDYELTNFLELFFDKINEILDLVMLQNSKLHYISGDILSQLNNIINSIKKILEMEKIGLDFTDNKNLLNIPTMQNAIVNTYINNNFNLIDFYNNFKKYPDLDILVAEEFLKSNNLNEKIYNQFLQDKEQHPDIVSIVENEKNNISYPVIDYPEHYKLDIFSERTELLTILSPTDLKKELLSSLKPKLYREIYIQNLLKPEKLKTNNLTDFISIYKQDAFNKFKTFLDENKSCKNTEIYSKYEEIINKLCKNIKLVEKAFDNKLYLADKSVTKEIFNNNKTIIDILYKFIINPQIIKNYDIKFILIKNLRDLIYDKHILRNYKIKQCVLNELYDLVHSTDFNKIKDIDNYIIRKNLLSDDLIDLLNKLITCEYYLNSNYKFDKITYSSFLILKLLEGNYIHTLQNKFSNKEITNIDLYLLLWSNKNLLDKILITTDTTDINYKFNKTFNLYSNAKINLKEIAKATQV